MWNIFYGKIDTLNLMILTFQNEMFYFGFKWVLLVAKWPFHIEKISVFFDRKWSSPIKCGLFLTKAFKVGFPNSEGRRPKKPERYLECGKDLGILLRFWCRGNSNSLSEKPISRQHIKTDINYLFQKRIFYGEIWPCLFAQDVKLVSNFFKQTEKKDFQNH